MIELNRQKYYLLEEPLKRLKINTLFARFVIEKKVTGKIYTDNEDNPSTFYVIHPYGMSLLFGRSDNETFNSKFLDYALNKNRERKSFDMMQAFPGEWDNKLKNLFAGKLVKSGDIKKNQNDCIELSTRVNFKFNPDKYLEFKRKHIRQEFEILRTTKNDFNLMKGIVVPYYFWDNADDFCENGAGFSLFHEGKLATVAFSAYIFDNELELGMETIPEFRGKGFAQYACSALIDYCLEHNYEPIWACKLENTPSYMLAQKLGFVPHITLPYYRLAL